VLVGEHDLDSILCISLIALALKCDLREDPDVKNKLAQRGLQPVSYEEGLATARAIRATRYLGK
jgi:Rho family protein